VHAFRVVFATGEAVVAGYLQVLLLGVSVNWAGSWSHA
jgi:hypothetical protein